MKRKRVILLGATGSIGVSSLDVMRNLRDDFQLVGLSCHTQADELLRYAEEFDVDNLAVNGTSIAREGIRWNGSEAVKRLLQETDADIVINGISGSDGLMPSVWALESGKDLALANKETIVMAGPLIRQLADSKQAALLPVDSEHSAIFHLLQRIRREELEKVVITASGGAFRNTPLEDFPKLRLEDALTHPTWDMGAKITIDSASMANKGLEVIEAHYLFDLSAEQIEVLIHPQSSIHSMIKSRDGSYYAQISRPDMRIPIQNALTYPEIYTSPFGDIDFTAGEFSFFPPEDARYPLLSLAFQTIRKGGSYPLAFNAANEAAVAAFREQRIRFIDIAPAVQQALESDWSRGVSSFEEAMELHRIVWSRTEEQIKKNMESNR